MGKKMYIKLGSNLRKLIYFANEYPNLWEEVKREEPDLINKLKEGLEISND